MNRKRILFRKALSVIYPNRCPCCSEVIGINDEMCEYCAKFLNRVDEPVCLKCGNNVMHCECKRRPKVYSGFAAPFYNDDAARKGIYSIKMAGEKQSAQYFGREIAIEVASRFSNVYFDFITSVPSSKKVGRRKSLDHAKLLAKEVAHNIEIPYTAKLLKEIRHGKPQHELSLADRKKNVTDRYIASADLSGLTILIIDDIKTTGATLDECAKQLLLGGAEKVYAASAVVARPLEEKRKNY